MPWSGWRETIERLRSPFLSAVDRAFVAAAVFLLGAALQINNGFFTPAALALVGVAALLAVAASFGAGARLWPTRGTSEAPLFAVLATGLTWSFVVLATSLPGISLEVPFSPIPPRFLGLVAAAAVATALIAVDGRRARGLWFPAALAAYAALGTWMLHASPHPHIDVVLVYRAGINALRLGHSPYHVTFPNIYGDASKILLPEGTRIGPYGDVEFGFPYPPLALLMAYPFRALRDYRYADVAALAAGAAAIGYASRSRTGLLAACALLFTPRSLFVLEAGWSEPLTILWIGAVVLAACRRRGVGTPLGLLVASKQHLALSLLFVPALTGPGRRRRTLVVACLVAAVVTVPFIVWDFSGFWQYVVTLQFREPFRLDSLSVLAPLAQYGYAPPARFLVVPTVAGLLAGLVIAWRGPRTPAGFALGLGVIFVLTFLLSKKAFCNYYFLVIACWCAAIAAADPPEGGVSAAPSRLPEMPGSHASAAATVFAGPVILM